MSTARFVALFALTWGCRAPAPASVEPPPSGAEPAFVESVETEPTRREDPMVEVPEGEFIQGTDPAEIPELLALCQSGDDRCSEERLLAETPATRERLPSFWIDRREVSNAEYEQCVASGDCPVRRLPHCVRWQAGAWRAVEDSAPHLGPEQPAVCITHAEAAGYCLNRGARLPSRSEWEKAARGQDGRRYPWGDEPPSCERSNYRACGRKTSEAVGAHPEHPSPYGALDMAGNVAEWVMPDVGPEGMYEQGADGEMRGGHFASEPVHLRAAAREFWAASELRSVNVGFRCALGPRTEEGPEQP